MIKKRLIALVVIAGLAVGGKVNRAEAGWRYRPVVVRVWKPVRIGNRIRYFPVRVRRYVRVWVPGAPNQYYRQGRFSPFTSGGNGGILQGWLIR